MSTKGISVKELSDMLCSNGVITSSQAKKIVVKAGDQAARIRLKNKRSSKEIRMSNKSLSAPEIIASMNLTVGSKDKHIPLDEDLMARAIAQAKKIPYKKLDPLELDAPLITSTLSYPFAKRTLVLPLKLKDNLLTIAVTDPDDATLFDELEHTTGYKMDIVLSSKKDILRFITEVYGFKRSVTRAAREMSPGVDLGNLEQLVKLGNISEIEANDRHVVGAVEYILHYAFDQRASDIHIEPKRDHSLIRMRIDGILHDVYKIPKAVHPAIVSRIKTISRLDLAERRKPQDGRFKTGKDSHEVEMRISTLPVAFGEKVVIRIFDPQTLIHNVYDLGFDEENYKQYLEFISRPNGLILITGPTGSGKTTTLYSTLEYLSDPSVNITTIEDPIEMVVESFNQTAINTKIDLGFANSLRHILRQDPDIIMVGEIRDSETAKQALQAALTGHLVFSTLHTNDTATSVTRLFELGLNPYLISSTLVGVIAQRLVRQVCNDCAEEKHLSSGEMEMLDIVLPPGEKKNLKVQKGAGCVKCRGTGLYNRMAIFELLNVTDSMRELINSKADSTKIMNNARADGTITLRESAIKKLAMGLTSYDEVLRVTIDK